MAFFESAVGVLQTLVIALGAGLGIWGVPNAPSIYSLDVRPDLAKQRQEKVIECMVDVEYITEEEGNNILSE